MNTTPREWQPGSRIIDENGVTLARQVEPAERFAVEAAGTTAWLVSADGTRVTGLPSESVLPGESVVIPATRWVVA